MTWRSTLKSKAREHIVRYYDLGGHQSPEETLADAQALVHGSAFLRDGVAADVCSFCFCYFNI